jgi:predicted TIM-barrel enzyme
MLATETIEERIMGVKYTIEGVKARLNREIKKGRPIILVGAGSGISAKFSEIGGADLIATYNIARYRMSGLSSMAGYLPIGDANQILLELGEREILPVVKEVPVIAGVLGTDPTRNMDKFLDEVNKREFSGVLNCPTIALVDGTFRLALEETGITYDKEVEMMRLAHKKGLFTLAFVTNEDEAKKMVKAGCDLIIAHMGNTTGGSIGSKTVMTIEEAAKKAQKIIDVAKELNPDIFTMVHGGPLAFPEDFSKIVRLTKGLHGFFGGSSAERLPVEKSIKETIEAHKTVSIK